MKELNEPLQPMNGVPVNISADFIKPNICKEGVTDRVLTSPSLKSGTGELKLKLLWIYIQRDRETEILL